ncbi:MAG: hypothetical protein ACOC0D_05610 [Spirochaeta sp.]
MQDIFTSLEKEGKRYLAIRTGILSGSKAVRKLYRDKLPEGYVIQEDSYFSWKPGGWETLDNEICLIGDYLEGMPLSAVLQLPPSQSLRRIQELYNALTVAEQNSISPQEITFHSLFFLESGGILFIPAKLDTQHPVLSHPDCSTPSSAKTYAVTYLLYTILCGEQPYPEQRDTKGPSVFSSVEVISPLYFQPALSPEASHWITTGIKRPAANRIKPSNMDALFAEIFSKIDDGRIQFPINPAAGLDRERRKRDLKFHMAAGIHSRLPLLAVAGIVALIAGFFMVSGLGGNQNGLDFTSLDSTEIVQLYYSSLNTLDHETMEGITAERAASGEIREVLHVALNEKVQMAHSLGDGIVTPQEYLDGAELGQMQVVYGISDVSIERIEDNGTTRTYRVELIKWSPFQPPADSPDSPEQTIRPPDIDRIRRGDTLQLEYRDDQWYITSIAFELLEQLPVLERPES